jgi:hypothetical protein
MASSPLTEYVSSGSKKVSGWFGRIDAEMFRSILEHQNQKKLCGAVAEIGVHHGRSFIAMCLALQPGQKSYCVDVFDAQHLNKDFSGKGNRNIFEENLTRFGVDPNSVTIEAKSSMVVAADNILQSVGPVRFFSVDGGHWSAIVENDLRIAAASLADHGVIALDDFHRPEWADVSAGYFSWYSKSTKSMVPFAIGFNKLYLCRADFSAEYKECLFANRFLSLFLTKTIEFQGEQVPVYQRFVLPEHGIRAGLSSFLQILAPDFYYNAKTLRRRLRGLFRSPSPKW